MCDNAHNDALCQRHLAAHAPVSARPLGHAASSETPCAKRTSRPRRASAAAPGSAHQVNWHWTSRDQVLEEKWWLVLATGVSGVASERQARRGWRETAMDSLSMRIAQRPPKRRITLAL